MSQRNISGLDRFIALADDVLKAVAGGSQPASRGSSGVGRCWHPAGVHALQYTHSRGVRHSRKI